MDTKSISISTGTLIRAFMVVLFASLFIYLSNLVIMLLVAVVLASAIEPWILWLKKWKLGRGASVSIIFLSLIALITSLFYVLLPPLVEDMVAFLKHLPELLEKVNVFGKTLGLKEVSLWIQDFSKDLSPGKVMETLQNIFLGSGNFFQASSIFLSGLINIALTFVIAFYLAAEENGVQKFFRIVIPSKHEKYVEDLWARAQKKFAYWLRGQLVLSLLVSLLIYVPLLIVDMPYAALLAVIAFFGELIPMVGLTLATIPALLVAFVTGGTSFFVVVVIIYMIVNSLENYVLYPAVMNKAVGVPSVIIVIAVLIGAQLAGIWGVILAVPLSAVLMELAADVEKRKSVMLP